MMSDIGNIGFRHIKARTQELLFIQVSLSDEVLNPKKSNFDSVDNASMLVRLTNVALKLSTF